MGICSSQNKDASNEIVIEEITNRNDFDPENIFGPDYTESKLLETFKAEKEPDGTTYYGEKVNGLKHGKGKAIFPDKSTYIGQWKEGKFHGKGLLENANGTSYYGQFYLGEKHGFCFEEKLGYKNYFENGFYKNNQKVSGMLSINGDCYKGDFLNDKYHGKGHLTEASGSTYEGEFQDGFFHGKGRYGNGKETYDGDWVKGKREGYGESEDLKTDSNFRIYQGQWKNDLKHGEGKIVDYDDKVFKEGIWENGKYVGEKKK